MAYEQISIHVPDPDVKERIKAAAKSAGLSVSEFLLACFEIVEEEQKRKEQSNG